MAVGHDSNLAYDCAGADFGGLSSPQTFSSKTFASVTNGALEVQVFILGTGSVTGVTLNGNAADVDAGGADGGSIVVETFIFLGSNIQDGDIVVSFSGEVYAIAVSATLLTDADQTAGNYGDVDANVADEAWSVPNVGANDAAVYNCACVFGTSTRITFTGATKVDDLIFSDAEWPGNDPEMNCAFGYELGDGAATPNYPSGQSEFAGLGVRIPAGVVAPNVVQTDFRVFRGGS